MAKRRLIDLVLDRDISIDRDQARRLILTGSVQVNGHTMVQPAAYVGGDVEVRLENFETSVSRAGQKLSFALSQWNIPVEEKIAADVGAAAGGFTEGLLRHGARRVYAIETGKGQLAWKIRQDKRVTTHVAGPYRSGDHRRVLDAVAPGSAGIGAPTRRTQHGHRSSQTELRTSEPRAAGQRSAGRSSDQDTGHTKFHVVGRKSRLAGPG